MEIRHRRPAPKVKTRTLGRLRVRHPRKSQKRRRDAGATEAAGLGMKV
jgi:hypothetical protein